MKCANCGFENPEGSRECQKCGEQLQANSFPCPRCGGSMEEGVIVTRAGTSGLGKTGGTYWCKERGLLTTKDKVDVIGPNEEKEGLICKDCQLVLFQY